MDGVRQRLIAIAAVEAKIGDDIRPHVGPNLSHRHYNEIGRLADLKGKTSGKGVEKDYSKLRKQDVARVIKAAGPEPSVRDIRPSTGPAFRPPASPPQVDDGIYATFGIQTR